jgi:DNA repair exonuclease SbcCD ATPase subunit
MKIISLRAENVKRLKAVEIRPNGNMVEITGKNGNGKTSVLDAIWWAMVGGKNIQPMPIRKGADSAIIELDLGKFKVTRTFRHSDEGKVLTTLKVVAADGAKYSDAQATLNTLIEGLSFDPLGFTRMKPVDQFNALRSFVPGFDFDENARIRKETFEKRTDVNRDAKQLRAQVENYQVPEDLPAEPIDKAELLNTLEKVHGHNSNIEKQEADLKLVERDIIIVSEAISDRAKRVEGLRAEIDNLLGLNVNDQEALRDIRKVRDELADLPEKQDPSTVRALIERADGINLQISRREDRKKLADRADATELQSTTLTAEIEALDKAKADAIGAAAMPVPGLTFGDGSVLLDGVPFEQASDAEQLWASIAIAGAMNPKLRVIRVRDGSLLDDEAMVLLAEYAEANDLQIWIERVDSSGAVGFVIEDGMVKDAVVQQAAE